MDTVDEQDETLDAAGLQPVDLCALASHERVGIVSATPLAAYCSGRATGASNIAPNCALDGVFAIVLLSIPGVFTLPVDKRFAPCNEGVAVVSQDHSALLGARTGAGA